MIRLFNAALDDASDSPAGIVLRGALDITTLGEILVDDYQREAQPLASQGRIIAALKAGDRLPDVDLGMRGSDFTSKGGEFLLKNKTYVIDGLQRISTIIAYGKEARIGATVHFNTTRDWERARFHKLNNWRSKVSPNVTLRNMREDNAGLLMLYGLSYDKGFVLCDRITWGQRMSRVELITALNLSKATLRLHAHKSGKTGGSSSLDDIASVLLTTAKAVGMQQVRNNMKTFFNLIDECWGIKSVQFKDGAIHMRGSFLSVVAKLLSDHHDFWSDADEKKLFISIDLKRKIAQFPVFDPSVRNLVGSSGKANEVLYLLLRDHINSGKRTKRLRVRSEALVSFADEEGDNETPSEV